MTDVQEAVERLLEQVEGQDMIGQVCAQFLLSLEDPNYGASLGFMMSVDPETFGDMKLILDDVYDQVQDDEREVEELVSTDTLKELAESYGFLHDPTAGKVGEIIRD